MEYIGELLKGVVIGIANILPGISGGMLAISMGVYDTIIHAVNRLFKEPVESIKTLFPYGLGAVAGIISLWCSNTYLGRFPYRRNWRLSGLSAAAFRPCLRRRRRRRSLGRRDWGR